jgi:hypothetical protein
VTLLLAAAGMAIAPVAANAASSLSLARISAPMTAASLLQADEDDNGGGSTAVILGVILVVLIGVAAISGGKASNPHSP